MRKLASVEKIEEVLEHPNADALSVYKVKGWKVVGRIGEYTEGDLVIFCEVDSWIPHHLAPFLSKGKSPREFDGVKGERLRTVRLRGELSQGLLLPTSLLNEGDLVLGKDVTKALGIVKWEKEVPAQLQGQMKGSFPHFIRKTDQERVQNIPDSVLEDYKNTTTFEVTEKLDGSSMTIYYKDGEWGVCSRNVELKIDQEGNSFVDMFTSLEKELELCIDVAFYLGMENFALQGELYGEGIQGNPYKIKGHRYALYDLYNIDEQKYCLPEVTRELASRTGLECVPALHLNATIDSDKERLLHISEGESLINPSTEREGLVYKSNKEIAGSVPSFKVISNKWLLREK